MSDERDPTLPDLRYVRELAKVFKQYGLDEIEIETGEQRILLRRGDVAGTAVMAAPAPMAPALPAAGTAAPAAAEPAAAPKPEGDFITSPFVGTFYTAPRPDAPSFVEVEADFDCEVLEILVDNGQAVEFGAKLYRVRKL